MDGTLAALCDLRAQINNQRMENKASQKDLRKPIDENRRQRPPRKRTRTEALEDVGHIAA
ncbi:hypothetical protein SARC_13959 [Sphaeroforma arctica JP610]|uniref:Uncharacterized protein n=1 Tax=Sphaeroforma arctica JP610 TaxID=667725 RepID=A0A0L0FBM1_9EUKA|nr:hypothetical protein SARC_13959 [Sphaeroforma arctica JP610]KNC73483.1 hypothetical protein SARC_13959 [Sphaeroforma arctica JP610]|eukprot:XP_014147385.1 hypothetical protein SARC_13959 [Sphaeroforma arctica JP610]